MAKSPHHAGVHGAAVVGAPVVAVELVRGKSSTRAKHRAVASRAADRCIIATLWPMGKESSIAAAVVGKKMQEVSSR